MARSLWNVFLSLMSRSGGTNEDSADDTNKDSTEDTSRFVPSPLDLSVRFSHGGSDTEIDRELSRINEQAREIEANRRDE